MEALKEHHHDEIASLEKQIKEEQVDVALVMCFLIKAAVLSSDEENVRTTAVFLLGWMYWM